MCSWVEGFKTQSYNPIILFKPQGRPSPTSMDTIGQNDFIMCIQTEFQRDMMCMFGSKCICIDTTYGTNMYDFYLVTIIVVDEFGEGIPVAWAISNREDTTTLLQFFKAVKDRTGTL